MRVFPSSKLVLEFNFSLVELSVFPAQKLFLKLILVWSSCLSQTADLAVLKYANDKVLTLLKNVSAPTKIVFDIKQFPEYRESDGRKLFWSHMQCSSNNSSLDSKMLIRVARETLNSNVPPLCTRY